MKHNRFWYMLVLLAGAVLIFTACGVAPQAQTQPQDGNVTYSVKVVDTAGNPISGVTVLLCDEMCVYAATDAAGVAKFKLEAGNYHASLMALPEGYAHMGEQTEFFFEKGSYELTLILKASEQS